MICTYYLILFPVLFPIQIWVFIREQPNSRFQRFLSYPENFFTLEACTILLKLLLINLLKLVRSVTIVVVVKFQDGDLWFRMATTGSEVSLSSSRSAIGRCRGSTTRMSTESRWLKGRRAAKTAFVSECCATTEGILATEGWATMWSRQKAAATSRTRCMARW